MCVCVCVWGGGIGKWSHPCGRVEGGAEGTAVLVSIMECQKLAIENIIITII